MATNQEKRERANVIFEYSHMQAIADGVLYPLGWRGDGTPMLATRGTYHDLPGREIVELFEQFADWQRTVEPTLPEEDRMFSAIASNDEKVWIIDDGTTVTLLYPSEY